MDSFIGTIGTLVVTVRALKWVIGLGSCILTAGGIACSYFIDKTSDFGLMDCGD